jgi:uncharacterized membrane protein
MKIEDRSRADLYAGLLIIAIATALMLPAFIRGFPTGADAVRQYRWTNGFYLGLRDGALYPRWLAGANNGLGSPIFIYYPPLTFYVAAGFRAITGNQILALTLATWLGMAMSGLTMYLFSRSWFSRTESVFAASLYMLIPAHVFEVYQLSALAEFWCFAWLPLLFETIRRTVSDSSWRSTAFLGISYALLIFTHLPLTLITSMVLPVYALVLTRDLRKLVRVAAGLGLGAGLGTVFLVPAMLERKYIRSEVVLDIFDYRNFFAFEHLRSAFKHSPFSTDQSQAGYVLENEPIAIGLALLLVLVSLTILDKRRAGALVGHGRLLTAVWVTTVISLLMTTRLTMWVWSSIPLLAFVPFPGRWQVISAAGVCFLAAAAFHAIVHDHKRRILHVTALAAAIIFNLWLTGLSIKRAPHDPEGIDPGPYFKEERFYNPIWLDRSAIEGFQDDSPLTVITGDASVQESGSRSFEQLYTARAHTWSLLRLRTAYFPGWTADVDGVQAQVDSSEQGNILLGIQPGEHRLTIRFEDTPPRAAGKCISAVSLLIVAGMLYANRRRVMSNE